ncbi:uncharacterized protein LOC125683035 [Ostrea edulis]|uniref:uncharacterized protein LOC125683035 n=1 Tax=Ostrea edulis TaxID=37623 RepID=UPI0024AFAEF2|nr:uncharacterized protein LOC125683035 [Ostrea edulis]
MSTTTNGTCQAQACGPFVYVTFAGSSKRHEKKVLDLCLLCKGAGFTVRCDSYRVLPKSDEFNVNQWRDKNFRRAACVLFCISPAYIGLIKNLEEPQAVAEESDQSKGAVYIYNLARAELVNSCSYNKRFFCVLFANPGVNLTVPPCFKSCLKFRFPGESQTLIKAMQARHSPNQELH